MEVLNSALEGLPAEKIRLHICWEITKGPIIDIAMDKVFDVLMSSKAQYVLFENANQDMVMNGQFLKKEVLKFLMIRF